MNVILNVDAITPPLTGIGQYALRLAQGLQQSTEIQNLKFFSAYHWVESPEAALRANLPLARARHHIPYKNLAIHLYSSLRSGFFRYHTFRLHDYVLHTPNYILMPFAGPSITTVHDLSYIHYPEYHPAERISFMERQMPRTLAQATAVITDSEFVKREIVEILGVPEAKVYAVPLGVNADFHPRNEFELAETLSAYGLSYGRYLLVVATLEPRKNLARLVEAYSCLDNNVRNHNPLVIAGAKGWLTEHLETRLAPLERNGQIKRLGYITQQDLPLIYAGAHGFVFPSLYEGFGLPLLEAMASGIPALTSCRSSLPEVAGENALLVEPENIDELATGIVQLIEDDSWRKTVIRGGLQQALNYSWERCIADTIGIYRTVLNIT
jgi:alpha-1,3-rhamnosyl/mannosyltransferase